MFAKAFIILFICIHSLFIRACNRCTGDCDLVRAREGEPEGPEVTQETEAQPVGPEEPKEEVKCPSHEPASFVKGKPQSILSLPLYFQSILEYVISIDALRIGVVMEPLLHYTLPCLDILSYLVVELGSSSSLALLLIDRSRVISCHLREIGSVSNYDWLYGLSWGRIWFKMT